MIKNFDEIRKQLGELAEVINSFKSEAVQLRVIELIFAGATQLPGEQESPGSPEQPAPRRKTAISSKPKNPGVAKAAGRGSYSTLARLVEEKFFKDAQTIGAIVDHCKTNLASHFKQSDFSGVLARYVREGKLKRKKNAEGQYEYTQE